MTDPIAEALERLCVPYSFTLNEQGEEGSMLATDIGEPLAALIRDIADCDAVNGYERKTLLALCAAVNGSKP